MEQRQLQRLKNSPECSTASPEQQWLRASKRDGVWEGERRRRGFAPTMLVRLTTKADFQLFELLRGYMEITK